MSISSSPVPMNVTLFGERVSANMIMLGSWDNLGFFWASPKSKDKYPYKTQEEKTQTRRGRGRGWCDAATSGGSWQPPKARGETDSFLKPLEIPCFSDFWPPSVGENKFLLFDGTILGAICYSSPRELTHEWVFGSRGRGACLICDGRSFWISFHAGL